MTPDEAARPLSQADSRYLRVTQDLDGITFTQLRRRGRLRTLVFRVALLPAVVAWAVSGHPAPWALLPAGVIAIATLCTALGWRPPAALARSTGVAETLVFLAVAGPSFLLGWSDVGMAAILAALAWGDLIDAARDRSRTTELSLGTTTMTVRTPDRTHRIPLSEILEVGSVDRVVGVRTSDRMLEVFGLWPDASVAELAARLVRQAIAGSSGVERQAEPPDALRDMLGAASRGRHTREQGRC